MVVTRHFPEIGIIANSHFLISEMSRVEQRDLEEGIARCYARLADQQNALTKLEAMVCIRI